MTTLDLHAVRSDLATLLAVDVAEVGPDDDLADLGLDSVRLMAFLQRLAAHGHDVDLATALELRTARDWAAELEDNR